MVQICQLTKIPNSSSTQNKGPKQNPTAPGNLKTQKTRFKRLKTFKDVNIYFNALLLLNCFDLQPGTLEIN
jgi:hypothetical protein